MVHRSSPEGRGRPGSAGPLAVLAAVLALCGLATAAPAQGEGPDTLVETYRDWVVRCVADAGGRVCEMTQELRQREGGQRVLALGVRRAPEGEAAEGQLTAVGPFGVRLADGLVLALPSENAAPGDALARLPFVTCLPDGCVAVLPVEPALLEALRAAPSVEAVLTDLGGDSLRVSLSLAGFGAAWDRLGTLR